MFYFISPQHRRSVFIDNVGAVPSKRRKTVPRQAKSGSGVACVVSGQSSGSGVAGVVSGQLSGSGVPIVRFLAGPVSGYGNAVSGFQAGGVVAEQVNSSGFPTVKFVARQTSVPVVQFIGSVVGQPIVSGSVVQSQKTATPLGNIVSGSNSLPVVAGKTNGAGVNCVAEVEPGAGMGSAGEGRAMVGVEPEYGIGSVGEGRDVAEGIAEGIAEPTSADISPVFHDKKIVNYQSKCKNLGRSNRRLRNQVATMKAELKQMRKVKVIHFICL